jgi:hypothetical protein
VWTIEVGKVWCERKCDIEVKEEDMLSLAKEYREVGKEELKD